MEIDLTRDGDGLCVRARGSREERPPPHRIDGAGTAELLRFAAAVREAALCGQALGASLPKARELHRLLFREGVAELWARLREASSGEPLLLRLAMSDAELQALPWEALCDPGSDMGFLASAPDVLPVRGVITSDPSTPRRVEGAVKVLAIAPAGGASLARIEHALRGRIASGEIEWLPPLVGPATAPALLFQRLRDEPAHVIHFLGHGGVRDGKPEIQLVDADGEELWLSVELLADQLAASFRTALRLVVLEACEGARPGVFASAAEVLAGAGADAVIAHLWPVRFDVARHCSEHFYGALAGRYQTRGDVARSLNEARRAILATFGGSAEAFCPVLHLRASRTVLFDFDERPAAPPPPVVVTAQPPGPGSWPTLSTTPYPPGPGPWPTSSTTPYPPGPGSWPTTSAPDPSLAAPPTRASSLPAVLALVSLLIGAVALAAVFVWQASKGHDAPALPPSSAAGSGSTASPSTDGAATSARAPTSPPSRAGLPARGGTTPPSGPSTAASPTAPAPSPSPVPTGGGASVTTGPCDVASVQKVYPQLLAYLGVRPYYDDEDPNVTAVFADGKINSVVAAHYRVQKQAEPRLMGKSVPVKCSGRATVNWKKAP